MVTSVRACDDRAMDPMIIRAIRPDEVELAVEVWLTANADRGVESPDDHLAIVRRQLTTPTEVALVAITGTSVQGFATGEPRRVDGDEVPGAMQLLSLFVSPATRGSGIGGRLVEAFLAEAAARGRPEVHLWVRTENAVARRLYERHGFTPVAEDVMSGGVSITAYARPALHSS
jgi:ribosomal protein S18 acetylase RimI-like enzyme